jgi:2-hydroxy-6-oxonona-2,4-dienedioate hydrolase
MPNKTLTRAAIVLAALVVGSGALIYSRYSKDINAARARISSGSQIVNTACGPIEYGEYGKGPPLLMVHGAGGGFDQGLDFGRTLVPGGFRVIAPSRFGYLRTPLPADASPMAQADAHACLLDALGLRTVSVIGGSAGAPSSMQLCLRHPDRCSSMVLLFPLAYFPHPTDESQQHPSALMLSVMNTTLKSDFLFWAASKLAPDVMMRTILATPVEDFRKAPKDEQERAIEVLRHILPVTPREKGLRNEAAIAGALPRYELERFRVPTLVIAAEDDLYGTYKSGRYTAQNVPGARFVGYPTGGHLLLGHRKDVSSELNQFLKGSAVQSPYRESDVASRAKGRTILNNAAEASQS